MEQMCDLLISHLTAVVPLLDELDEVCGGDGDSGSNTLRSLTGIRQAVRRAKRSGVNADLETWASAARTVSIGHTGMLIAVVFSALAKSAHNAVLRPVELRDFCAHIYPELQAAFSLFRPPASSGPESGKDAPSASSAGATLTSVGGADSSLASGDRRVLTSAQSGPDLFEAFAVFTNDEDASAALDIDTERPATSQPATRRSETLPAETPARADSVTAVSTTGPFHGQSGQPEAARFDICLSPGIEIVGQALSRVAHEAAEPITYPHLLIGEAAMEVLSDIAATDRLPDPGACVMAILIAALHATYENEPASLPPTIDMMRALWEGGAQPPQSASLATLSDPDYVAVDLVLEGFADEIGQFFDQLRQLAATHRHDIRLARVGTTDAFGMQSWRLRIDTISPELALPQTGSTRLALLKDSRAGDAIGFDELALREAAAGIVFLTRPTTQRAATARVLICLQDPAWIREAVATGAHVVFRPTSANALVISELLASAPAGVTVVVAPEESAFEVVRRAHALAQEEHGTAKASAQKPLTVVEVVTDSTLAAIMAGRECARIFMPALAHRNQQIAADMLRTRAREAADRLGDFGPEDVDAGALVRELSSPQVARVVLFAPTRSHPFAEQVFAQLAVSEWPGEAEFFASDQLRVSLVATGED